MKILNAVGRTMWTALSAWAIWSVAAQPSGIPVWAAVVIVVVIVAAWLAVMTRREVVGPGLLAMVFLAALSLMAGAVFAGSVPLSLPDWSILLLFVPVVGLWLALTGNTARTVGALALIVWLAVPVLIWGLAIGLSPGAYESVSGG